MINAFVSGSVTIQFATPPDRNGSGMTPELFQTKGKDSAGNEYIYDKGVITRNHHVVVFPRETDAVAAALNSFDTSTVHGSRDMFTWYDEAGTSHTVRLIAGVKSTPIGPNKNRIELALDEDVAWSAPPAPASFDAAKNATVSAPVWILRLTAGSTDYFLSDSAFAIASTSASPSPGWPHGVAVTTLALVSEWGEMDEQVTGDLNEIKIADFSCKCLIDPVASPNLEALARTYELEKNPVELYLWYHGLNAAADPPRLMMRGYIKDHPIDDDTTIEFQIGDETERFYNYIGTKIDLVTYPEADPDDVGKVIPIPYGTVSKGACLAVNAGVQTSIPSAITAAATSIVVSQATGLAAGTDLMIDAEQIHITAVNGSTLTVQRGQNSTTAVIHQKGAIAWELKTSFDYFASDVPVSSLPKVYASVGQAIVDVTGVASRYIGSGTSALVGAGAVGGQHPSYPGKAVVTLPGYVTAAQMVSLMVSDGISVNDAISVVDGLGVTDSITLNDVLTILQGMHDHPASTLGTLTVPLDHYYGQSGPWTAINNVIDNNASTNSGASPSAATANFSRSASFSYTNSPLRIRLKVTYNASNSCTQTFYGPSGQSSLFTLPSGNGVYYSGWLSITSWSQVCGETPFYIPFTLNTWANLSDLAYEIDYGLNATGVASAALGVDRAGAINKTGTVTKTGTVSKSGSATKSGTVTLSGNSVANTLIGDAVYADKVRGITNCDAVVGDLLTRYCSDSTLTLVGSFPSGYAFNGEIVEYLRAIDWLDAFAFQCRAYFRKRLGVSYLIVRPDSLSSVKTLAAVAVDTNGVRTYSRQKVPLSQVINTINLLYNRDWTQGKSDAAYQSVAKGTDATSISNYGACEQPNLFQFDFVTADAMAVSLVAFYIAKCATRPWLHTSTHYLDQSELKFADAITLGFNVNIVGEIQTAGLSPGNKGQIDLVKLVVKV